MTRKIQLEYQIHKQENEKIILLDVKNTFKNIFDMLKKKHPNIKIELVNETKFGNIFFKNLYKIGYRYFKIDSRDKKKDRLIIKSFQQHYLPKNVSGKIDLKTLNISDFLANYPK